MSRCNSIPGTHIFRGSISCYCVLKWSPGGKGVSFLFSVSSKGVTTARKVCDVLSTSSLSTKWII